MFCMDIGLPNLMVRSDGAKSDHTNTTSVSLLESNEIVYYMNVLTYFSVS